jgi:large subunit ribosomal protein L5
MAATDTAAPPARLKARYLEEIRPALIEQFGYSSVMQAPKLEKITVNMGVGLAKQDSKMLKAATDQLAQIAGQQPSVRRARKSIAAFKLREGMPVGLAVTLRAERGYEFLDRLISIAIPRIRDFRGLNPRSFDGRGNYSMGVKEQIIFPEIDYDAIDMVRGLDITITTSAQSDVEAFALLMAFGMPFSTKWRPKGFDEAIGVVSEPTDDDGARVSSAAAPADVEQPTSEPEAAEPEAAEPEAEAAEPEAEPAEAPEAEDAEQSADETASEQSADEDAEQPTDEAPSEPEASATETAEAPIAKQDDAPGDGDAETTEKESTD